MLLSVRPFAVARPMLSLPGQGSPIGIFRLGQAAHPGMTGRGG